MDMLVVVIEHEITAAKIFLLVINPENMILLKFVLDIISGFDIGNWVKYHQLGKGHTTLQDNRIKCHHEGVNQKYGPRLYQSIGQCKFQIILAHLRP